MCDRYDQKSTKGFIRILGLLARTQAHMLAQHKEAVQ